MSDDAGAINLGLESFKGFLGKSVQYILGFVGTILFARILGPVSFGGFYFLLSLVYIADNPLRGLASALEKRVSETDSSRAEIVGGILLIHAVVYLILLVALTAFGEQLTARTNVDNAPLVFFLIFVSLNLFLVSQHILSGGGYPSLQIWNDTLRSILTTPLQLAFVLLGFGAAGMGYGLAAASFLTIPVAHYYVPVRPKIPSRETIFSVWRYARYSIPNGLVNTAYARVDVILIATILSTGAAGQYETAYKLTMPATLMSSAIAPALMPKVSNIHSAGEDVSEEISNAIAFTSALAVPIFFGALAIPQDIVVTVYGGEYRAAASLLVGLALYQLFNTQVTMYGRTVNALDMPDVNMRISFVTLAVNIVLGLLLIFELGALGIVVATVVAEVCRYLMYTYVIKHHQPTVRIFPRTIFEQVGAGVLMFITVELASNRIAVKGWLSLLLLVGLGATVYGVGLLAISPDLRVTLYSVYEDLIA